MSSCALSSLHIAIEFTIYSRQGQCCPQWQIVFIWKSPSPQLVLFCYSGPGGSELWRSTEYPLLIPDVSGLDGKCHLPRGLLPAGYTWNTWSGRHLGDGSWNIDWRASGEFSLYHRRPVQHLHYCRRDAVIGQAQHILGGNFRQSSKTCELVLYHRDLLHCVDKIIRTIKPTGIVMRFFHPQLIELSVYRCLFVFPKMFPQSSKNSNCLNNSPIPPIIPPPPNITVR